jgi:hypothetical protein
MRLESLAPLDLVDGCSAIFRFHLLDQDVKEKKIKLQTLLKDKLTDHIYVKIN